MDNQLDTMQMIDITLTINGQPWSGQVPAEEVLLDLIRHRIGMTGTKRGCESQICGACTVLVDGQPISSCSYLAFEVHGKSVTTIEGVKIGDQLHPLQSAFIRNVGAQCGYCTPGEILAAKALLSENPTPTYDEVTDWLKGNICRCGCYPAIARSILEVAKEQGKR